MTERPRLDRRIDYLEAEVARLQSALDRILERGDVGRQQQVLLVGQTFDQSAGYPTAETTNTFGVRFRDASFDDSATGNQDISGNFLSADIQRYARTIPERYVTENEDIICAYIDGKYYILGGGGGVVKLLKAIVGPDPIAAGSNGIIILDDNEETGYWEHATDFRTLCPDAEIWVQQRDDSNYDIVRAAGFPMLKKGYVGSLDILPGNSGGIFVVEWWNGTFPTAIGHWDHADSGKTLQAGGEIFVFGPINCAGEYQIVGADCEFTI